MKQLKIGGLIAQLPIIQGGMGVGISLSGLASAVANEGGIGVIATAGIGMREPDIYSNFLEANIRGLRREIRKARKMTQGVLGVNVMVALSNYADLVRTAVEEKIDVIFSGAGLPLNLPEFVKKAGKTKLAPIISSARAAGLLIRKWLGKYDYLPDAIVVEGPLAGGHLGFKPTEIQDRNFSLEKLLPEVVAVVKPFERAFRKKIPVIAAGGIYTGGDIHRFMGMGAAGVQMATRFVATKECDASPEFKKAVVDSRKEDLVIIKSPVGMPGRAIRNRFIDDVNSGKKKPFRCPYRCIITCDPANSPFCIALALTNAMKGNLKKGFAFAGANAHRIHEIVSVKELIAGLVKEYGKAAQAGAALNQSLPPLRRENDPRETSAYSASSAKD